MSDNNFDSKIEVRKNFKSIFLISCIFGLLGILIYSINTKITVVAFVIGNSLLFAGSAFFIGAFIGFLFGVPKTLQVASSSNGKDNGSKSRISYKVNDNLEQISDWLTKILVGVGLSQLIKMPVYLRKLAIYLIPIFGNNANSGVYGVVIIIYYLVIGFLTGYMVTRIYIGKIFRDADKSYLEKQIKKLQKQSKLDAEALEIANQLLSRTAILEKFSENEIKDAFSKASESARFSIFSQAEAIRSSNFNTNKKFMEQTIPVFKALIALENDSRMHFYYAQIGYALKDKEIPDYKEAEKYLSDAINIRGADNGYTLYEFNRAICYINLDNKFQSQQKSDDSTKRKIIDDLNALKNEVGTDEFNIYLQSSPEILEWKEINKINFEPASSSN